jgi:hypothetical protein
MTISLLSVLSVFHILSTPRTFSKAHVMKSRACLSCYHRKAKCDRKQPCNNCVDSRETCSFPGKIRRNRPRRKTVEALLIEKRINVSEPGSDELDNPTSSSSTTEDHDYMVVDSTSQSRLLVSNA